MTRLNQSRRGLIGYTYSPQVCNDVAISTGSRQMSLVQEQAFEQGMAGDGRLRDIVRGILSKRHLITKHGPAVIDAVVKGIQFMNTDEGKQLKQDFAKIAPNQSERISNIVNKYTPPDQYQNAAAGIYKGVKAVQGKGLELAGAGDTLPGDMLKKKLLQKMVRERRMKSLGDRVKTPVLAGMNGGFIFTLAGIIAAASAAAAAAASAASAAAASAIVTASAIAGTTIIGTTTVGSVAASVAGTILSSAAGAIVNKIAGKGKEVNKKVIKSHILNVIKDTKLTIADFPTKDKIKLKAGFEALKKNPTKAGVIALGRKMAPVVRGIMKTKLTKNLKGMTGSGLGLAGGSQAKKFDNNFVKHFNKTLTT